MMKSDLVIFIIARVKRLIWLRQLGLLNHWANSFLPRPYRCSAPLASLRPTSNERLTLNYLSSAFLLYGVGVGVSILAFVLEVISTWWNATTRVKSFGSRHSRINAQVHMLIGQKKNSVTFLFSLFWIELLGNCENLAAIIASSYVCLCFIVYV